MQDEGRYYDTEHGKLASVTTILKLVAKPALIQWASNCAVNYILKHVGNGASRGYLNYLSKYAKFAYQNVSKEATDTGTEVHDAVECFLKGKEHEAPASLEAALALDAFKNWWNGLNAEVLYCEEKIYSPLGFAGRLDIIARIDGVVTLIDLKTSKSIYEDMGYQLAAYRTAWNELYPHLEQVEAHGIIRVDKTSGEWEYCDFSSYYERDWKIFNHYLSIHQHLQNRKQENKQEKKMLKSADKGLHATPRDMMKRIMAKEMEGFEVDVQNFDRFKERYLSEELESTPTDREVEKIRQQTLKAIGRVRKYLKLEETQTEQE